MVGDNDSVRFALIRACGTGPWAGAPIQYHLEIETACKSKAWFARVPTEANISDYPSRQCEHALLLTDLDRSSLASRQFADLKVFVGKCFRCHGNHMGDNDRDIPRVKRKPELCEEFLVNS